MRLIFAAGSAGAATAPFVTLLPVGWYLTDYQTRAGEGDDVVWQRKLVMVFVNEGGLGPAEGKNPAAHSTDGMMVITAGGRGLGLKTGRHIRANEDHTAKVVTSAMNAAGVMVPGLGEVQGRLEAMFTG